MEEEAPRPSRRSLQAADARRALWDRVLAGDSAAADEIFGASEPLLLRFVRLHLGKNLRRHTESVDIVQTALDEAVVALRDGKAPPGVDPLRWLCAIAINQIRTQHDYFRAQRRDVERLLPKDEPGTSRLEAQLPADQTDPGDRVERREVRSLLDRAVDDLPASQRRVVQLRDYQALEWSAVAERLERSVPAAKQLHQRAWQRLRATLRSSLES